METLPCQIKVCKEMCGKWYIFIMKVKDINFFEFLLISTSTPRRKSLMIVASLNNRIQNVVNSTEILDA